MVWLIRHFSHLTQFGMLFTTFLATSVLAVGSLATPIAQPLVVHEKRSPVPAGWTRRDVLDRRAILPMRIGLTQGNLHKGHDWLMDVSDPESEKFGRHWTAKEVAEAFAPR
jgi:tripeptidyl-peptidase-1